MDENGIPKELLQAVFEDFGYFQRRDSFALGGFNDPNVSNVSNELEEICHEFDPWHGSNNH